MTNQASIQTKISKGYGIAAQKLGNVFAQFRPTGLALSATDPSYFVVSTLAAFDVDNHFSHTKPAGYNHPVYFALTDLDNIQVADYFVSPFQTFFIANIEPLRPPMAIHCNRVVSIFQPKPTATGPTFYSGNVGGTGTPAIAVWPCSILIGPKGETNISGLPADPRAPWYAMLFPAAPGLLLKTGDVLIDDLAHRYTISATELTSLGWRCTMSYSGT